MAENERLTTIRTRTQFQYCPLCGEEVSKEDREYAGVEVRCPEHGELLLK